MSLNSVKAVNQVFEQYQKARISFVQSVADLAQNQKNIEALKESDVFSLLRPLLLDTGTVYSPVVLAQDRLTTDWQCQRSETMQHKR